MVNATLWFATSGSETGPGSVSADDKIIFNSTTKILQPLETPFENNIKQTPNPTNDGSRIINVTENGLKGGSYELKGYIKIAEADHTKLKSFTIIQQITTALPFGRFGVDYPNADLLSLIPSDTLGLSFGPWSLKHNSTDKTIEFDFTLLFGGQLV